MSSTSVFPHFDPFADLNADSDEKAGTLSLPYCDACHTAHVVSEPSISLVDCCCSTVSQSCLSKYINHYVANKSVSSIPCPQPACGKELTTGMIQSILSPADFEAYLHATLVAFIEQDQHSFVCPNDACKSVISIAPFVPPAIPNPIPETDEDGKPLSVEAWLHFCEFRVRCRECNLNFCSSCKTAPYHKGYTCAAYKEYQSARHCRFCSQRLDSSNQYRHASNSIALKDVCTEEECVKKAELSCERMLPCGCPCQGIKGETTCLPCLKHDLEISSEFCGICYVEELGSAPCIKMTGPCLHVFHYQCALTKITSKWPGARISFEFRTCPVCKQNMAHPALETVLAPVIAMETGIIDKAMQRLKYEARESDPAITQKGGEFFGNAVGFAMKNYLFYQCFKCARPYFAGGYQCVDASVQGFDPSELICPSCQPSSVEDCKVHGKDWLAYKCRYCCSFANWYCWGNCHFCDKCHKSGVWQQLTVFRSGKNKKKLWEYENCASLQPQVDAIGKDNSLSEEQKNNALGKLLSAHKACVLGVRHPPTGIEFGLGCSMCEDSQSSSEKLKENEAAVKAKLAVVKEGLGKQPRMFVYRHDLDENGVMWYLGTCGRTQPYVNPAEAGFVRVISSGLMGDSAPLSAAVGRELVRCVTTPVKNSWFVFELVDLQLALSHYTLRHYNSWDTECLRHWQLEGSNESVQGPWEIIIQHTNDESLRKKGATHTWQVPNTGKRYRLFRLFQSGRNSNKNYYLPCSGLEFYGTLFVSDAAEAVGSPAGKVASPKSAKPSIAPPPIPPPRPSLSPPSAVSVSGPRVFTYRSDLDQNGFCYWLGTRCGSAPAYNNPADIDLVRVRCSELAKDGAPINAVVGRDIVRVVSVPKPNQWFVVDFTPSGYRIRPTAYTLRHYASWDLEALRNWKLEGSVNGNDWFVLSVHADDQALNGKGSLHTWQLGAQQGHFTQFRVWQTGLNSNNHHYLALSGFEVYGEVFPNSPPLATPFDAVRGPHAIPGSSVAAAAGAGMYPQYSQQPYPVQVPVLPPPPSSRPLGPPPVPMNVNGHISRPPPIPVVSPADGNHAPHSPANPIPSSPQAVIPFRYQHDMDTNGLFYYLGTRGRTAPWSNPCNQRLVSITCAALATNPPSAPCSALVNRELVRCVSQAKPDMWFMVDLLNIAFHCTHYSLQHYASFDVEALRNWRFEASQDGSHWDVLREHNNDQSLQKAGQTHTWPINDTQQTQGKCYRLFRIWQTGLNSNNNHYLALSGLELYGWMPLPAVSNRPMTQQPPPMPPAPPRLPNGPPLGSPLARPPPLPPAVASTPPPVNGNPFSYGMVPVSRSSLSPPSLPAPPPAVPRPSQSYPVQSWPAAAPTPSPLSSQQAAPSPPASNGYNPFGDSPPLQPVQQHPLSPAVPGGSLNPFAVHAANCAPPPSSSPPPPPLLSALSINANLAPPPHSSPSSMSRSAYQPLSTPSPRSPALLPPFQEGMTFEYNYDFDEGGIMYFFGTKQRTAPWRNPDDLGVVRVTSVPLAVSPASAPASAIVGREVVRCVTQPNRESWFCIDLLTWYCRPTHYTLRHYDSFDSEALRDWKLQGSNDGKKWSKLVSHKKDEALNGKGSSHTWEIPATKKAYRMFRILQTGKNSNGHWYCALSGFEVYGQLYTQPPKVKD